MRRLFLWFACAAMLSTLSACKQRSSDSGTLETADSSDQMTFVGFCRRSAGECTNSCPSRDCFGKHEPQTCADNDPQGGEYACYRASDLGPEGPPGGESLWNFLGCVRSPNECRNSNCNAELYVEADPSKCDPDYSMDRLACYCKK